MILPPNVYKGDWREMKTYVVTLLRETGLPCMLYNNPVAYGTDFLPEQIAELAEEHANLAAVKESSTDVRRVTAIRALLGDRLAIFVGVDDAILEAIGPERLGGSRAADALRGNQLTFELWDERGEKATAEELYRWFLPLLRLDTVPKFVQLIKQVQQELGGGQRTVPDQGWK